MDTLNSIAAEAGLGSINGLGSMEALLPLAAGVLLILVVVNLFSLPLKLIWNGISGAAILWVVNFVGAYAGFHLNITIIKALIAGFFGIPGAAAVVLFEIFGK